MKTIKLNEKEYQFRYSFRAFLELLNAYGLTLQTMHEFAKDFKNTPIIIHYGISKELSIEEVVEALDKGTFDDIISAINLFSSEVSAYFVSSESPNELTNSNVSGSEG